MNYDFDVAIVGGGPVGSTLGYKLAKKGVSVCIIEKKKYIGYPLQCAGILSKNILDVNDLPDNLIINQVKGAYLSSPNQCFKVQKNEDIAYIIDRVAYDQYLAKKALDSNVKIYMQNKVLDIDADNGTVRTSKELIRAKIIVGADGCNSVVSKKIGNDLDCYTANQYLVKIGDDLNNDYVDIFTNNELLPGFLWVIPLKHKLYRVGLFSDNDYINQNKILNDFLDGNNSFTNSNLAISDYEIVEKYTGYIPIYNKNRTLVKNRVLLVGDAAGHVKPTTGGGLILAFNTLDFVADIIKESLVKDDIGILKKYPVEFNKRFSDELNNEIKVHKTLNLLSDSDLDYLFKKVKEYDGEDFISEYGDMDNQSVLIKEFLKKGLLFKFIPKLIKNKILKIWS